ncbi:HNH endonuclease signature motif containing protein [Brachybacterium vulturis]|uniref:HNH endonuclease signature motif containing protein n=1 Tax=Brachybacterium vulturis TaxID=2017484 RepID=UPI0012FD7E49|nr:HNH endonuclease signature motif containing protein [Brachybacterium vulturis]
MGDLRAGTNVPFDEDAAGEVSSGSELSVGSFSEPTPAAPVLPPHLRSIHAASIQESRHLAARFTALAPSFHDPESEECDADAAEAELLSAALALRCTRTVADRILRDAHIAVTQLPLTLPRLECGEFPAAWFDRILRRTRHLTPHQMTVVDAAVSLWPATVTTEQFHHRLSRLLGRVESQQETPAHLTPEGRRRVELLPTRDDGIGCLRVVGPAPEILALAQRLDSAARAIQAAQRRAFEAGEAPPLDPRGTVAETATPASLALLQYDLLGGAAFDTDGVQVPQPRFRLNVTVPVLTLLGGSQEPGLLEGTTPIPAAMARELAGQSETWHRVLTDPCSGTFLPLPATRYTPTRAMLEHLRLRNTTCAVPGCTRPTSWASEADHIEEYDHGDPEHGGLTEIENLHLLCWQHHRAKTAGLLDPTRLPSTPGLPGRTAWSIQDRVTVIVRDNEDLATPHMTEALMDSWARYQARRESRRRALERRKNPPPPPY